MEKYIQAIAFFMVITRHYDSAIGGERDQKNDLSKHRYDWHDFGNVEVIKFDDDDEALPPPVPHSRSWPYRVYRTCMACKCHISTDIRSVQPPYWMKPRTWMWMWWWMWTKTRLCRHPSQQPPRPAGPIWYAAIAGACFFILVLRNIL